jgi:hypothetical protein
MATLTIHLEDDLARYVEEAARRERKSISVWVGERVKPGGDRTAILTEMEKRAVANGYPAGWLTLFGSLADDDSFAAPDRNSTRAVDDLNDG